MKELEVLKSDKQELGSEETGQGQVGTGALGSLQNLGL